MALRSLARGFPAGLLRRASAPPMGPPVRGVSPASGARLMATRCQEKETQELILLRQNLTDFKKKTTRDLDELIKSAKLLNKAANVSLGVSIIAASWAFTAGSGDQA